ncbi:pyridoxamine 5'-phosphate oxidase family protein [Cyanobium sp. N5-Cardenillas]|uniref:pyridoxamine 5'-phosphate oxidase family protein n=1 Tax=Cyanobium sp. N5-Cardenillas TaxID=2823720 RepID=UPI0020CBFCE1|nr:pyridoxamine 5'-phosphate oxidase family protein [Cyanobium sp. N5-Cardenillas]MCP9787033.1 pyridoxamine 5'-phosphate oxidase family protein [Cyanobium sp. N5-Cardenillas]
MGQSCGALSADHIAFIAVQKLFFVGTATADSTVNVSPKGRDALRVLDESRVIWLNLTGSGNETAAHVQQCPRMTLMFCAFEGPPQILRLYGTARTIQCGEDGWDALYGLFEPLAGARQIFDLAIDKVQTSCGMAVPTYAYGGDRTALDSWARRKGAEGLERYWQRKNRRSIDGLPAPIPAPRTIGDGAT